MKINIIISRKAKLYAKAVVYDPYTMYVHQAMKKNEATQFLKTVHE